MIIYFRHFRFFFSLISNWVPSEQNKENISEHLFYRPFTSSIGLQCDDISSGLEAYSILRKSLVENVIFDQPMFIGIESEYVP